MNRPAEERVVLRIPTSEFARVGSVLERLAVTSYGVHGRAKFVRAPASRDSVALTSHSARLLGPNLQMAPGVGRVLLKLVEAQRRSHGDGGLTVVACAAKILRKSAAAIDRDGVDARVLVRQIASAMDALEKILTTPATVAGNTAGASQNDSKIRHDGMLRRVQLNDLATMKSLVMSMIRPKRVCSMNVEPPEEDVQSAFAEDMKVDENLESVSTKLLDALLSSLDPERAEPFVQILAVKGGGMKSSFSAPQTVLMDIPLPTGAELALAVHKDLNDEGPDRPKRQTLRVALFDTSLEGVPRGQGRASQKAGSAAKVGVVEVEWKNAETAASSPSQLRSSSSSSSSSSSPATSTAARQGQARTTMWSPGESERVAAAAFVAQMTTAGVSVVASQKTIHRDLKRRLISAGVIPLERLSLRYIRAVACVTGAPVLGHSALRVMLTPAVADGSVTERFGTLKSVCVRRIGAKKYLQLVGQQQVKRPISTLVLRSRCSHALRELEETCRGVLRAVPRLFREPFILPGAGEAEIRAAAQLRGLRPQTAGAQVLAAAIREIGEAAAGGAVGGAAGGIRQGQTCAGGRSQEEVWDIASVRINAFRLAQESACACLRMGTIVMDR